MAQMKGGALRTSIARRSRPGAALLICGSVLFVPLLLTQSASGVSSARPSDGAVRGTAEPPTPAAYVTPWVLASASQAASGTTATGETAGDVTVSAAPTTTVPTTVPPPTTTAPTHVVSSVPSTITTVPAPTTTTSPPVAAAAQGSARTGIVTYYDTAPGMCASPRLPFGTVVTITNPDNGRTVSCTVDDREADTARDIDLATATFAEIAPLSQGVISNAELSW